MQVDQCVPNRKSAACERHQQDPIVGLDRRSEDIGDMSAPGRQRGQVARHCAPDLDIKLQVHRPDHCGRILLSTG
jgi:hypothetical protein